MLNYDPPPLCQICNKPVDLARIRFADEDGHAIHARCYLSRLSAAQSNLSAPHHTE